MEVAAPIDIHGNWERLVCVVGGANDVDAQTVLGDLETKRREPVVVILSKVSNALHVMKAAQRGVT